MNCILIDDETPALKLLEDNVKQIPFLNIVACCKNPVQLLDLLRVHQVDLVFLDIQMPGINGLELLASIKHPPMVIMVTAYPEYALDGFNLDVVDYLVKPVPFSRFLKAVQKANELYEIRQPKARYVQPENDDIFVNANYSLVKVRMQDITYIEGLKDYVRINLAEGNPVITRMSLKMLEERLKAAKYMRVHKSFMIALDKIESIQKTHVMVAGVEIPISDAYRQALQAYVQEKNF
ncbi:LytTR family DNA-binding domain-containing protein [Pedobacter sp.]|jgi:DNA-binding LytR/AlgR family response regulator|uniref:LytR/AlgR family response regulator transcription factor n=1 Tax=Pedobacter sp. TaxID=1411316 RepID=UPI002C3ADF34|nr:LytTR family DNA-binding domain-containing protein [Pedobacter sp.]HWW41465.1 LytTR family DNA-binding domain-containing protein [Pedobacter sp.]